MKDYELTGFETSDFKDDYGNTWCNAVFLGIGEPVRWVLKDPSVAKVGETYYGEVKEMTSKAGKKYLRFYKAKAEDVPAGHGNKRDQDHNDGMRWGNSLTNAVATVVAFNSFEGLQDLRQQVIETANYYYNTATNEKPLEEAIKDIQDPEVLNDVLGKKEYDF